MKFRCATCGQEHDLNAITFGADRPVYWDGLTEKEKRRSVLGEEQCVIRGGGGQTHYFVLACLEIPICGTDQTFAWGVWVSLSEESFTEMSDHWDDPARAELGPYFGWLSTRIPEYPDTVGLKTMVHNLSLIHISEPTRPY